jgi:hypothetical protein
VKRCDAAVSAATLRPASFFWGQGRDFRLLGSVFAVPPERTSSFAIASPSRPCGSIPRRMGPLTLGTASSGPAYGQGPHGTSGSGGHQAFRGGLVRPLSRQFRPFGQRLQSAEAVRKRDFQGPMRERQGARQVSRRFRFHTERGLRRPSSPDERLHSEDGDHPLQIVGEPVQDMR